MLNNFAAALLLAPWTTKDMTFFRRSNEYALAICNGWHNLSKISINLLGKYYN
jgi:hypothetical protein